MRYSYSHILIRILGHLVQTSLDVQSFHSSTQVRWLLDLLLDEVFYGRAEFFTELRPLAEDLSQYHRSLLLESLMHFDPVDV